MSDEPLPGDEYTEHTDISEEEREAIAFSSEPREMLYNVLDQLDELPREQNFDGGLVIMTRSLKDGKSAIMFRITDSIDLVQLLGCIEVVKRDIINQLDKECGVVEVEEDSTT